jgi:ubiquinone/menaquinone biosynthesis C-methylase UbiE
MSRTAVEIKPALAYHALTPLYDRVVAVTTRERRFKSALLDQARLQPGQQLLDVGSGTGTLAMLASARCPDLQVVGLDADPRILARARRKAGAMRDRIRFDEGLSTALPYADASFDRVLSSLFFHHLRPPDKAATAREMLRVLRPGGELHVADWGRAGGPVSRAAFVAVQLLDGFETTRDAVAGRLPTVLQAAGFTDVVETQRMLTLFGVLSLYRAGRPGRST